MAKNYAVSPNGLDNLVGTYSNDKSEIVLIKENGAVWLKNEVFGQPYEYVGKNTFQFPCMPEGLHDTLTFEILPNGKIEGRHEFLYENNQHGKATYWKIKK
ncbi:hypothetical protein EGI22_22825 [Lacihabitans sp. LS3-19]|nr:hypothetical protein [Lacihabitans sp. LS3-19]